MINTEVLKIDPANIDLLKIKKAARVIEKGGLVAFPTETVYGLGADSMNPQAVARIFEAKGRPLDDPLIVHVSARNDLFDLARDVPAVVQELICKFWPGPLTLVLKRSERTPDIVTAGLDTVAIRMPANIIAMTFIKEAQTPIAAPSANLFGCPSSTSLQHIIDDLEGRIDLIIDGGKTPLGVESTILDLTRERSVILRPGGIEMEKLKGIMGDVMIHKQDKVIAPGMYPRHYSPRAKVMLVENNDDLQAGKVRDLASRLSLKGSRVGIIAKEEHKDKYNGFDVKSLGRGDDLTSCAANLFSVLREFDKEGVDVIIAEGVEDKGIGIAIMDRLRKAAELIV
ncbi:MAG: L-threonylcarbamoyladenylate synthase [Candidatus Anammoxibacter sp.]